MPVCTQRVVQEHGFWLGSQVAFDITEPKDENPFLAGSRQWTLSFEAGVHF